MIERFAYAAFVVVAGLFWIFPAVRKGLWHEVLSGVGAMLLFGILFFEQQAVQQETELALLGGALALFGISIAVLGVFTIFTKGRARDFEESKTFVRSGVFYYFRHPLYYGMILLAAGAALVKGTVFALAICSAAALLLLAAGKVEESHNLKKFGKRYEKYLKKKK